MEEDRREDGGRGWGQGVVGGGVVLRTAREGCCNEPNIVTLRVEKESHCTISNCWRGVGGGYRPPPPHATHSLAPSPGMCQHVSEETKCAADPATHATPRQQAALQKAANTDH